MNIILENLLENLDNQEYLKPLSDIDVNGIIEYINSDINYENINNLYPLYQYEYELLIELIESINCECKLEEIECAYNLNKARLRNILNICFSVIGTITTLDSVFSNQIDDVKLSIGMSIMFIALYLPYREFKTVKEISADIEQLNLELLKMKTDVNNLPQSTKEKTKLR